jgi:hypothetical protein
LYYLAGSILLLVVPFAGVLRAGAIGKDAVATTGGADSDACNLGIFWAIGTGLDAGGTLLGKKFTRNSLKVTCA